MNSALNAVFCCGCELLLGFKLQKHFHPAENTSPVVGFRVFMELAS